MPVMGNKIEETERAQSPVLHMAKPKSKSSLRESGAHSIYNPFFTGRPRTPAGGAKPETMDRQEIMRRIKERGAVRQSSHEKAIEHVETPVKQTSSPTTQPSLLPSPELDFAGPVIHEHVLDGPSQGLEITRPRSALHRGDFREENDRGTPHQLADSPRPSPRLSLESPQGLWTDVIPDIGVSRYRRHLYAPLKTSNLDAIRPRAMSGASLSHSFSYQAPTSPLVNQSNAEDLDDDFLRERGLADQNGRRRTFSPASSFTALSESHDSPAWYSPPASFRRESSAPYKAHQPRRSITSLHSLPQTPLLGRRSSGFGSSPLQSSMVGSFEESILKGRMSSTPSRPLDFTAHIGVLGMGNCKPALKCPPHIIVSFPAVFYSYGYNSSGHDSQPSPYVGLVDLENAPPTKDGRVRRKVKAKTAAADDDSAPNLTSGIDEQRRQRQKALRRSHSPLDEPKGAYRIPAKGQLQIIIKNPNKTAVKLFLVPYDVSDIQPGQKTFIRQRSYSAGPIVDAQPTGPGTDKPVLRYLIHLQVCCTAPGRIWLYQSVRVVFANRVPDGKEKLRNETQIPEPKYTQYRPQRASRTATPLGTAQIDGLFDMEMASSRSPSSVDHMTLAVRSLHNDGRTLPGMSMYDGLYGSRQTQPSYHFPALETVDSRPSSRGIVEDERHDSRGIVVQQDRPMSPLTDSSEGTGSFTFSRSSSSEKLTGLNTESLLSRRLRDLEMNRSGKSSRDKA